MVTNSKCKYHQQYKAWRATNPPKKAKFKPIDDNNTQQGATATTATDASTQKDDDSPEAQAERDAEECDLMDSLPLDDDDDDDDGMEFFDAMESFYNDDYADADNDKENY